MAQVAVGKQIWNYHKVGRGRGKAIVIMHGWGRSGNEWIQIARELSSRVGCMVYVLDLPGFGGSSLPKVTSIAEYSELVFELLSYLKIRRASLIGHSLGGRLAVYLAANHADTVERLVLINPAAVKPPSIKRELLKLGSKVLGLIPINLRRKIAEGVMDEDYRNSPALRDLYRIVVARDLRFNLPKINAPTTVIWGEQDPILPVKLSKIYAKLLLEPTIRIIWEAGHDPHLTHYESLKRVLEEVWT